MLRTGIVNFPVNTFCVPSPVSVVIGVYGFFFFFNIPMPSIGVREVKRNKISDTGYWTCTRREHIGRYNNTIIELLIGIWKKQKKKKISLGRRVKNNITQISLEIRITVSLTITFELYSYFTRDTHNNNNNGFIRKYF